MIKGFVAQPGVYDFPEFLQAELERFSLDFLRRSFLHPDKKTTVFRKTVQQPCFKRFKRFRGYIHYPRRQNKLVFINVNGLSFQYSSFTVHAKEPVLRRRFHFSTPLKKKEVKISSSFF